MRASVLLAAVAVIGFLAPASRAQSVWRAPQVGVSLDVAKYLESDGGQVIDGQGLDLGQATVGTFQSLQFLSARVPVGGVTLVAELPLAFADTDVSRSVDEPGQDDIDGFGVGNPYLGAEIQRGFFRIGLGARAPLAARRTDYVGYLTDAERPEATILDHASATLSLDAARPVYRGVRVRFRFAPSVLVYTGEGIVIRREAEGEPERVKPDPSLVVSYGALVEGEVGLASLSLGLVGYEETRYARGFGFVSARGGVTFDAGPARPGLSFRAKISENGPPEPILGLSLDVPLR